MRTHLFIGLILLLLSACSSVDIPVRPAGKSADKIGYLGFGEHQAWAIQFNDCTVYKRSEAIKYLWFDRTLTHISCYRFKPSDVQALPTPSIRIYDAPKSSAEVIEIARFEEMLISKSGWGSFPPVYEQFQDSSQGTWLRVKEGWLYFSKQDARYAIFYSGQQDEQAKAEHQAYYLQH